MPDSRASAASSMPAGPAPTTSRRRALDTVGHRQAQRLRQLGREGAELAGVEISGLDVAGVAPRAADDAMHVVDQAGGLEVLGQLDAAGDVVAARHLLPDVEPDPEGHRAAD